MKNLLKIKNIHIAIIILGILFNCISIFHPNLWFDEAYSVGLANKSFIDIWKIGGNDVHPILYYWILHIIYLFTHNLLGLSINGTIIAYRVFSMICISLLGILGFSHIRKDFGEKTGVFFSFFSFFLPVICIYAAEVRMYSLAVLLVTTLAIYAYRLFKDDTGIKNWIIFGITSLACIYVHYYGLMAAGIINCVLLFYFIKQKRVPSIIKIMVSGAVQLLAYIPWMLYFIKQLGNVSKGFWIGFEFPKTIFQLIGVQFAGNTERIDAAIGFVLAVVMFGYIIFRLVKNKKSNSEKVDVAAKAAIGIYLAVIVAAIIITAVMKTSIVYYRYLFVITGLFIFFISYGISKEKNKYIIGTICVITLGFAIWSNYLQISEAYNKNNMTQIDYLKENVKSGDVFAFDESNFGTGSVISLYFTDNKQIFYNPQNWGVEEAYRAFGDQLEIHTNTDFLNECTGRVWVIDSDNFDYYNKVFNNEDFKIISRQTIKTGYEDYTYNMTLIERVVK